MTIAQQIYEEYYSDSLALTETEVASSHWKNFSKKFEVKIDSDGQIKKMRGYGFGESDKTSLISLLAAKIGNSLLLSRLHYKGLSDYIVEAKTIVRSMGLQFSQDAFRQACTSFLIQNFISKNGIENKNFLIIGDGHGILSALIAEKYPSSRIFLIDLGATLYFQAFYLGNKFKDRLHTLLTNDESALPESGFFYCPADKISSFIVDKIDIAINVASMQEMTIDVVNSYFTLLREKKTNLFYCCNRLEKTLPDGKVTRFKEYAWKESDQYIIDEKCPWHQYFFGNSKAKNVLLFGFIPIPFLHRYDGVHWHRLTYLSSDKNN
jgi:hypothetical protein